MYKGFPLIGFFLEHQMPKYFAFRIDFLREQSLKKNVKYLYFAILSGAIWWWICEVIDLSDVLKELAIQADLSFQWIDARLRYVDSHLTLVQGEDWGRDKSILYFIYRHRTFD